MFSKKTIHDETVAGTKAEIEKLKRTVASLVTVQGADMGKQFFLRRNDVVIGRDAAADIMLKDMKASRLHAKIEVGYEPEKNERRYTLIDLNSKNHVYVN